MRVPGRWFSPLLCLLVVLSVVPASAVASDGTHPEGLRPPLADMLEAAAPGDLIPAAAVLVEQVDGGRLRLARVGLDPDEARRVATGMLKSTARATQTPMLTRLRELEAQGLVARIRPLWIGNVVGFDAVPAIIREIAARPEVAWVNHNPKVDISLGAPHVEGEDDPGVDEVECGTDLMRAPEVWNDLGITGEGAVIAVIDSGVCWTHSDIADQVWVNPGEDVDQDGEVMDPDDMNGIDDDGNGFVDDLVGWNFDANTNQPSDTNSHGSHVAGTIAGDGTAGTQAGMAPDAKIMIIKGGLTFSDEVDIWNAMQYAADNGADAISMSLGWPHNQNPDRATWRQNCENTIDAGTAMVIAAGNEGQGNEPDNVRTPGDVPRIISVGATDCNDSAASFSSRGPVSWENVAPWLDHPYPPGLIKPDIAAPGVSTKSHNICSGYSFKSGTSMATPHVAGAVALMVSANPGLEHDEIKAVLEATAVDVGFTGKDNTFGSGRVDAYAAVDEIFGLAVEAVNVVDDNPGLANGDGGSDLGEVVGLEVVLFNQWSDRDATDIEAIVTSSTPGITVLESFVTWPDITPQTSAGSAAPHATVRVETGCNVQAEFSMTLRFTAGGTDRETRRRFSVRVGTFFDRTPMTDDFESDQGWTVSGTSVEGVFVREDPKRIRDAARNDAQPDDDVTPVGTHAWVTGNTGKDAGDDDVDDGNSILTSPIMDLDNFEEATIDYWHWFYAKPGTIPASDFMRMQWSTDGSNWNTVEELAVSEGVWRQSSVALPPAAFAPGLRVRVEVDDPGSLLDSHVEGLIDDLVISGRRVECDDFSAPFADPPNPVGDSLMLSKSGPHLRLDWTAPPVDGSHGAASLYSIYTSDMPTTGFALSAQATVPHRVEPDALGGSASVYYLVGAENAGGTSGEEP